MEGIICSMAVALVASATLMAIIAIPVIVVNAYRVIRDRISRKAADKVEAHEPSDPTCGGFFMHPYWTGGYDVLTNN